MHLSILTIQFVSLLYAVYLIAAFCEGYFRKWAKVSMDVRNGVQRILWPDMRPDMIVFAAKVVASLLTFLYASQIAGNLNGVAVSKGRPVEAFASYPANRIVEPPCTGMMRLSYTAKCGFIRGAILVLPAEPLLNSTQSAGLGL